MIAVHHGLSIISSTFRFQCFMLVQMGIVWYIGTASSCCLVWTSIVISVGCFESRVHGFHIFNEEFFSRSRKRFARICIMKGEIWIQVWDGLMDVQRGCALPTALSGKPTTRCNRQPRFFAPACTHVAAQCLKISISCGTCVADPRKHLTFLSFHTSRATRAKIESAPLLRWPVHCPLQISHQSRTVLEGGS